MITIDRLKYFVAAAQLEHVGRAAARLHTSPSVISSSIKELEVDLKYALFLRDKNRVKLTSQGKQFLERAEKVLKELAALVEVDPALATSLRGHYKIGASHFLMQSLLVPNFIKLKKKHPQITAEFVSLDSGLALLQVRTGQLDGALIFHSSYAEKIDEKILCEGHFDVFVKKDHPVLRKPRKTWVAALNQLPAISFRTSAGANFWESHPSFSKLGILPSHQFFYDDTATALQLLDETGGWAFMPSVLADANRQVVRLGLTNRNNAPVNLSLILGPNAKSSRFFEELERNLCESLKKLS